MSDDRTITADSDSSEAQDFEDALCKLETDATEIEVTQIASRLQSAADGYLALAPIYLSYCLMNYHT